MEFERAQELAQRLRDLADELDPPKPAEVERVVAHLRLSDRGHISWYQVIVLDSDNTTEIQLLHPLTVDTVLIRRG